MGLKWRLNMRNDYKIKKVLKEINTKIEEIIKQPNMDAYTDRLIESIIEKEKEIEKLHYDNFHYFIRMEDVTYGKKRK